MRKAITVFAVVVAVACAEERPDESQTEFPDTGDVEGFTQALQTEYESLASFVVFPAILDRRDPQTVELAIRESWFNLPCYKQRRLLHAIESVWVMHEGRKLRLVDPVASGQPLARVWPKTTAKLSKPEEISEENWRLATNGLLPTEFEDDIRGCQ